VTLPNHLLQKQEVEVFVSEYLIDLNGTRAAYSRRNADKIASRLLGTSGRFWTSPLRGATLG